MVKVVECKSCGNKIAKPPKHRTERLKGFFCTDCAPVLIKGTPSEFKFYSSFRTFFEKDGWHTKQSIQKSELPSETLEEMGVKTVKVILTS